MSHKHRYPNAIELHLKKGTNKKGKRISLVTPTLLIFRYLFPHFSRKQVAKRNTLSREKKAIRRLQYVQADLFIYLFRSRDTARAGQLENTTESTSARVQKTNEIFLCYYAYKRRIEKIKASTRENVNRRAWKLLAAAAFVQPYRDYLISGRRTYIPPTNQVALKLGFSVV